MIIEIINLVISILLFIINASMFHALKKYKKNRSKEEYLFLEKTFFTLIVFIHYIVLSFFIIFELFENDRNKIYYQIEEYLFNVYIVLLYLINLFMSLEIYYTYTNPFYYYLIILNQKSRKIYELILFCFTIGVFAFNYFDPLKEKDYISNYNENNLSTPFILLDKWKCIFFLLINIITLFFIFKLSWFISKFDFDKRNKLKKVIKKKIITNLSYSLYGIYNFLLFGYLKTNEDISSFQYKVTVIIGSFLFISIIIIDNIFELSILATSRFALYKLRNSYIGFFSNIFPNDFGDLLEEENLNETMKFSELDFDITNDNYYRDENETEISLIAKTSEDNELISVFKNDIYLEDYFLCFFDQYINILMASLFKMYNSKLFSTNIVNAQKLKEEFNISCSAIGSSINASSNNEISETKSMMENGTSFNFHKKRDKDPFILFKDILGTNNNDINVKITTYFTNQCVFNIFNSNLISKQIATSLVSHFIINKKDNKEDNEDQNRYWSLTAANAKEEYFKNLKNISFKSYDKNFNLDFFITNEEEISLNNKKNKNIAKMINQYFNYIQNGKGQTGSFLPILIGIFKIKINKFKTVLVYVSRNTLVQNVPKNFFTYWQLVRFDEKKPNKVASSKYLRRTIVKDDPLFERPYSVENKKDNPDLNKILLKNYSDFKEILSNDIKYLKDSNLSYVNLLMMYYEYENTQKHEKAGAIKIKKTDGNKAEIIQVDMPQRVQIEEEEQNIEEIMQTNKINEFNTPASKKTYKFLNAFYNGKDEEIFGDEEFEFMPDKKKLSINLIDYSEKVNINGYEGNFDNFICMCFFTFENVFDTRQRFNATTQPYTKFKNKIMEYFSMFNVKN